MTNTGPFGSGNNIGVTAADVFRPNVWSKEVLMFVKSNLVLVPLVKHYDADVKAGGKTLEIPNVSTITANQKAQNTVVTLNYNVEQKNTIYLDQHYESSFLVEDIAKVQSVTDLRSDYTQAAAYAIAQTVDFALASGMTTAFLGAGNSVGTYGAALDDAAVLAVNRYLDEAKAPGNERALVVTPKGKAEMLGIDKYIRYDAIGVGGTDNSIRNGQIGEIYGVRVYMSQNLVVTPGTPDEHNHLFFHKEAFAIALQLEPRTQATYEQQYLGWLVTVDVLFGCAELRPDFGWVIKG